MSVALAGKIAGNARKSPPTSGPNFLEMMAAIAEIAPPNTNRAAYSYHLVWRKVDVSKRILISRLS
jgi:hypothetical protein